MAISISKKSKVSSETKPVAADMWVLDYLGVESDLKTALKYAGIGVVLKPHVVRVVDQTNKVLDTYCLNIGTYKLLSSKELNNKAKDYICYKVRQLLIEALAGLGYSTHLFDMPISKKKVSDKKPTTAPSQQPKVKHTADYPDHVYDPSLAPDAQKPTNKAEAVVELKYADKIMQRVFGTSDHSIYFVIGYSSTMRVACRVNGVQISVRAENYTQAESKRLAAAGFSLKNGYASMHVDAGTEEMMKRKVIGSILFATGQEFESTITDANLLWAAK